MKSSYKLSQIIEAADSVLVLQADNPDADSLGSALALEAILSERGKTVMLYCGVDIPDYLKYLEGWSRVSKHLPARFDTSIIVDASTLDLFEKLTNSTEFAHLKTKPCVVIDHHLETANNIDFAQEVINISDASSTCEVIYNLCGQLAWELPPDAMPYILTGILGDTQGLSNQLASAQTFHIVGDLVAAGVNRPQLEEKRRAASKMPESIFRYKAKLIERTELYADGRLAIVNITQDEITNFSPLYNPGPLIQTDMLQIEGIMVGIVCKVYSDGRITGMIRCNPSSGVGGDLAAFLGGGGHPFAAGFKIQDGRSYATVKNQCIDKVTELLDALQHKRKSS